VNSHANEWTLLEGEWTCTRHEQSQNTLKRNRKLSLVESRLQEHSWKEDFPHPEIRNTNIMTSTCPLSPRVLLNVYVFTGHIRTTIVTNIIVGIFQSWRIFFRKPTDRYLRAFLDISATNNIIYNFKNKLVYFMLYIIPWFTSDGNIMSDIHVILWT